MRFLKVGIGVSGCLCFLGGAMASTPGAVAVQSQEIISAAPVPTLNPWAVLVALSGSDGASIICDPIPKPLDKNGEQSSIPTVNGANKKSDRKSTEPCILPETQDASIINSDLPQALPPEESPVALGLLPLLLGAGAAAAAGAAVLASGGGGNPSNSPV